MIDSVQMMLGAFPFRIAKSSYDELTRVQDYRWEEIDTLGGSSVQGGMAKKPTITLSGKIDTVRAGKWALKPLELQASLEAPLTMVDFFGLYHGLWVIRSIKQKNRSIVLQGLPRAIDFTLDLLRYD